MRLWRPMPIIMYFVMVTLPTYAQSEASSVSYTYSPVLTNWSGHIYSTVQDQNGVDHSFSQNIVFCKSKADALARCDKAVESDKASGYAFSSPIIYSMDGPSKDKPIDPPNPADAGWGPWVAVKCITDKGISAWVSLQSLGNGKWKLRFKNTSDMSDAPGTARLAAPVLVRLDYTLGSSPTEVPTDNWRTAELHDPVVVTEDNPFIIAGLGNGALNLWVRNVHNGYQYPIFDQDPLLLGNPVSQMISDSSAGYHEAVPNTGVPGSQGEGHP